VRLVEIDTGINAARYPALKDQLAKPGTVHITNASFSSDSPSLGTLEDLGAGRISRNNPPYKGRWFGFEYFKKFPDGTPIQASIDLGHGQILKPGEDFMEEV
jgi:hypothetical protein